MRPSPTAKSLPRRCARIARKARALLDDVRQRAIPSRAFRSAARSGRRHWIVGGGVARTPRGRARRSRADVTESKDRWRKSKSNEGVVARQDEACRQAEAAQAKAAAKPKPAKAKAAKRRPRCQAATSGQGQPNIGESPPPRPKPRESHGESCRQARKPKPLRRKPARVRANAKAKPKATAGSQSRESKKPVAVSRRAKPQAAADRAATGARRCSCPRPTSR